MPFHCDFHGICLSINGDWKAFRVDHASWRIVPSSEARKPEDSPIVIWIRSLDRIADESDLSTIEKVMARRVASPLQFEEARWSEIAGLEVAWTDGIFDVLTWFFGSASETQLVEVSFGFDPNLAKASGIEMRNGLKIDLACAGGGSLP